MINKSYKLCNATINTVIDDQRIRKNRVNITVKDLKGPYVYFLLKVNLTYQICTCSAVGIIEVLCSCKIFDTLVAKI